MSNKRVHFLPNDTVFEIESREDYTKKEILACWYTKSKLNKVGMRRLNAALKWEADESSRFCIREQHYTTEGGERTAKAIERCLNAVMDEQDVQWATGEDDFDRIAVLSQEASKSSADLALLQAAEDELAAQKVYKRMEKQQTKKSKKGSRRSVHKTDSHTTLCSDLSHPEDDDSIHSSCEMIESDLGSEQHTLPGTEELNKERMNSLSRRVKAKALKLMPSRSPRTATGITAQAFKTIRT